MARIKIRKPVIEIDDSDSSTGSNGVTTVVPPPRARFNGEGSSVRGPHRVAHRSSPAPPQATRRRNPPPVAPQPPPPPPKRSRNTAAPVVTAPPPAARPSETETMVPIRRRPTSLWINSSNANLSPELNATLAATLNGERRLNRPAGVTYSHPYGGGSKPVPLAGISSSNLAGRGIAATPNSVGVAAAPPNPVRVAAAQTNSVGVAAAQPNSVGAAPPNSVRVAVRVAATQPNSIRLVAAQPSPVRVAAAQPNSVRVAVRVAAAQPNSAGVAAAAQPNSAGVAPVQLHHQIGAVFMPPRKPPVRRERKTVDLLSQMDIENPAPVQIPRENPPNGEMRAAWGETLTLGNGRGRRVNLNLRLGFRG